jgi:hypothetical protein
VCRLPHPHPRLLAVREPDAFRFEGALNSRNRVIRNADFAFALGPKPCAGVREDVGEASTGECAGQPLSRERKLIPGADAVASVAARLPIFSTHRSNMDAVNEEISANS